ncbi:MAG: hypothetical protein JWR38_5372 [Mucilaginibacter sp.]|nr:hypothetical protein [Mucilaginibacter sp.]
MPKISHNISIAGLNIDRESKIPLSRQLYEGIRMAILHKQIRPGQRLPSSRTLAEDIGLSRNIVLLAYEQLTLEGYLTGSVGNGSFVSADAYTSFTEFTSAKKKIITPESVNTEPERDFNPGYEVSDMYADRESIKAIVKPFQNPVPALDHFPYRNWAKCASKIFRSLEFLQLSYDDAQGYYPLREAIAAYLRINRALICEPEQIIITYGTQQALNLIASIIIKKGDQFWIEDPGYINAKLAFQHAGGNPCFVPVTKNGLDLDYAKQNYPNARLAFITPSHQFPLGGSFPIAKRLQLLDWAAKNRMWVIEDDYDSELRYAAKPIPSLQGMDRHKRVIYTGTFSKVLFPGLRIGYLVLPDEQTTKVFKQAKAFADRQNSITDQLILNDFMREGYHSTHLRKMRVLYKKRQDHLVELIRKHGEDIISAEKQGSGMHIIAWLRQDINDQEISTILNRSGVINLPLSLYSNKFKHPPALVLGYTAFNEQKNQEAVLKMMTVIKDYLKEK